MRSINRAAKWLVCLASLALLACDAGVTPKDTARDETQARDPAGFTKHLVDSVLLVTDRGLFSVEMDIPGKRLAVGENTINLIVHDQSDRDASGAKIDVTPWMPAMGHGVFSPISVTDKGRGLYTVDNIVIPMGGRWEFRINIELAGVADGIVFDFPDVGAATGYEYIKAKTAAGYDAVLGTKNPLEELEPEVVEDNGQTIKVFTLTVKNVGFELFPDAPMMGWGFNGSIPGPTLRVTEGDRVRIVLKNETGGRHTIHVHGQRKPVVMDGVPYIGQTPVSKGESYTYEFTAVTLGTSFYHCHVDGAHHVDMGMYGAFIVEPKVEKLQYDREYVMILDEWPTQHIHVHEEDDQAAAQVTQDARPAAVGSPQAEAPTVATRKKRDYYPQTHNPHDPVYDAFTINGRAFPLTEPVYVKEGEQVRIRFINTGYQAHYMHTHSHRFKVVARDGAYVDEPQLIDTVHIGSAQRVDIILHADNPGIWPFHCHRLNHVANEHIYPGGMMTFIVYEDYAPAQAATGDAK